MNQNAESLPADADQRYERRLAHDYFVRFHMSVILIAVTASGVLTSKGLLDLGIHSLRLRYPLAVLASYLVFLLLVRIWIWYVSLRQAKVAAREAASATAGFIAGASDNRRRNRGGGGGSFDFGSGPSGISGGGSGGGFTRFGGGSSGGGGASDSWESPVPVMGMNAQPGPSPAATSPGSGGWFPKLDIDIDGDGWVILLLLAALVLAIVGAGGYLVYAAPHILPEAAWQAALATTLTRVSKEEHHDWMAGVLRSTCVPFGMVLFFAGALGWAAHSYCPAAPRLVDVIMQCVFS